MGSFSTSPGGKGFNMAVGASRAGGSVLLRLKVGGDEFTQMGLDFIKKEKVRDLKIIKDQNQYSGIAASLKETSTGNHIGVVDLGANQTLAFEEIPNFRADIKQSDVFLTQLETFQPTVEAALVEAKRIHPKIITILNPAMPPNVPLSDQSLRNIDVLTPNENEVIPCIAPGGHGTSRGIEKAANSLINRGVRNVAITLGEKGALLISRNQKILISPPRVKVVDTLGAGDAFNGALAVALAEGAEIEEAVKFAVKVSALKVSHHGSAEGMPTREEIESFVC